MPYALSMRRSNFSHLILPGSATASARIQIAAFSERIGRKKVMSPHRSAVSNTAVFDPDGISVLCVLAAAGLIVRGARRGAFVAMVRRPGHTTFALAVSFGSSVTPKISAGHRDAAAVVD